MLFLVMMLLTSCSTTKSSLNKLKLPEIPIAGEKVGKEFIAVCNDVKCKEIYAWLVKLHDFRREYNIYREELAK